MGRGVNRVHLLERDPSALPADFWESSQGEILVLRRWARENPGTTGMLPSALPELPSHVWLASSGTLATAGMSKWVALSKAALLESAAAVNAHLGVQPEETWGLTLPLAHAGGLGILARARLGGQHVRVLGNGAWSPAWLAEGGYQLLSLVPTQVHDLVQAGMRAPRGLRVVVVGGDRLSPDLLQSGRALGWPLFPSYGLTECASQVATATFSRPDQLVLLPHVRASLSEEGLLRLESASLFTGTAVITERGTSYQARQAGPWTSGDLAELRDGAVVPLGRADMVVKVRGEKVDVPSLERELTARGHSVVVVPLEDGRDGVALWAVCEGSVPELEELNRGLLPHQKLRGARALASFPRGELGKIKRGELREWLLQRHTQ